MAADRSPATPELEKLIGRIRMVAFDFDGVFTDNMVYTFDDGREAVCCSRGDGLGLSKLRRLGVEMIVISTETNPVVTARCRKLNIQCIQACEDKRAALEAVTDKLGATLAEAAFVGNDINDAPCLESVGLPIIVQDAHPDVVQLARYQTRALGGHGAVREVCDLFASVLTRGKG